MLPVRFYMQVSHALPRTFLSFILRPFYVSFASLICSLLCFQRDGEVPRPRVLWSVLVVRSASLQGSCGAGSAVLSQKPSFFVEVIRQHESVLI